MAVIMYHQCVADPLGLDARSLGAERAQTNRDVEQAVGMGAHRRQKRWHILHGKSAYARRTHARLGGAAGKAKPAQRQRTLKQPSPIQIP